MKVAPEDTRSNPQKPQTVIKVIPGNPERMAPLVGYFPSGFDPTKSSDLNSTKVGVFRHKERSGTRLQLVVTPEKDAEVDFVGTSYAGEAQAGEHCAYGLGILDKATHTLKIVPIANNKVFRLEPKVQGADSSNKELASSVIGKLSAHEKTEKLTELHNRYGTKKSIRQNKRMQTLKHGDDPVAQNDLNAIKNGMTNREDLEEVSDCHNDRNTPPFNASATTPQEAYPLDKIISTAEWKFLQDIHKLVEGGSELPRFVSNRIHKLQQIVDEEKKNKLACIFSYIMHLIKFKDLHSMELKGLFFPKAHRFPSIIRDKFSRMFDAVSRKLSTEKSNLLISYVLVLTLFVDEFQTSLTDIAKDLRMSTLKLRTHYETLGCKVSKKNNFITVTLPVPLQFPTLKRKRSNR
ncbi:putative RNA polymerase I associated factor, A49 [Rosa chinensis]|uniref:Putative RNA polymerase I associated factor, A49 n=2 Tax=Rosa chinensis TaxID=74649 RepID=A0A2P6S424_ROSCH|nr:putative RNA polymerase I associated factor, A49 [Rosa chinensis]